MWAFQLRARAASLTRSPARKELGSHVPPSRGFSSMRIEDLRAIPWVFSWAQCRLMLPG